jgi:hypothetical protein
MQQYGESISAVRNCVAYTGRNSAGGEPGGQNGSHPTLRAPAQRARIEPGNRIEVYCLRARLSGMPLKRESLCDGPLPGRSVAVTVLPGCAPRPSYAVPDSDLRLLRLHSQAWLYFVAELGNAGVKTLISFLDQLAVETAPTGAGLVAGSKQDSASLRIEGEGHSPFTEFLHVCMLGRLERVHSLGSPTVAGISGVSVPAQEPPSGHPHPGRGTLVQTDQPAQRPGLSAECALKRKYAVTYIDAGSCSAAAEGRTSIGYSGFVVQSQRSAPCGGGGAAIFPQSPSAYYR